VVVVEAAPEPEAEAALDLADPDPDAAPEPDAEAALDLADPDPDAAPEPDPDAAPDPDPDAAPDPDPAALLTVEGTVEEGGAGRGHPVAVAHEGAVNAEAPHLGAAG